MTLAEVLAYLERQASDEEEMDVLIERLAPVLLDDPQLLRAAITAAWNVEHGAISKVCAEHAAEVESIAEGVASDATVTTRPRVVLRFPVRDRPQ